MIALNTELPVPALNLRELAETALVRRDPKRI